MSSRLLSLILLLSLLGCAPAATPPDAPLPQPEAVAPPALPPTTSITVEGQKLTFAPKTCLRGEAGFGWGLGSVKVKVLGHEKGECVFEFTDEVEGGYAVYRCRVPVDAGPVTIEQGSIREGESSWPGIITSFPRDKGTIVRRGNILLGGIERLVEGTPHYVSIQSEPGEAVKPVPAGSKVLLRFRVYVDNTFTTLAEGAKQRQELTATLGQPHQWRWVTPAIEGIGQGERRRLRFHSRIADGAKEWHPALLDGESLYLEMEVVSATGP